MNPPTSLCHSGAGNSPCDTVQPHRRGLLKRSLVVEQGAHNASVAGSIPAVSTNIHSAHLPALDSDGAAVLPAPRRALTAADALRAAGFRKLPGLWVREADLGEIVKFAERYADRVNEIRADVRKETP